MYWFLASLGTAVLLASVNILDQILLVRYVKSTSLAVKILAIFSLAFFLFILVFFNKTIIVEGYKMFFFSIMAGLLEIIYIFFYLKAIEHEDVSFIVPIFSVAPLIVAALSWFFFRETTSPVALMGIFLAIVGLFFLIAAKYGTLRIKINLALLYIIIATIIFSFQILAFDNSLHFGSLLGVLAWSRVGVVVGALIITFFTASFSEFHAFKKFAPYTFFLSEVLYLASVFLIAFALDNGPATLVTAIQNIQPLFVFLFCYFVTFFAPKLLPEKFSFIKPFLAFLSIVAIIFGISLLQF